MPAPMSRRPVARFAIVVLLLALAACQREASPPAPAAPVPEPRPAADFCNDEADGDYLNPLSCRSQVICRNHAIEAVRACPAGEVIDALAEQRPPRCTPVAQSGLNADCSRKPVPLSEVLPEAPASEAEAVAHP